MAESRPREGEVKTSDVRIFRAAEGLGPTVEGDVVVVAVPFSPRYDLDRDTGVITRIDHPSRGVTVAGKILMAPAVQGGVAAGWALLAMRAKGVGIAGLVLGRANPVMVHGAVTAGIPILVGVDDEIFSAVRTGDRVVLEPAARRVVLSNGRTSGRS